MQKKDTNDGNLKSKKEVGRSYHENEEEKEQEETEIESKVVTTTPEAVHLIGGDDDDDDDDDDDGFISQKVAAGRLHQNHQKVGKSSNPPGAANTIVEDHNDDDGFISKEAAARRNRHGEKSDPSNMDQTAGTSTTHQTAVNASELDVEHGECTLPGSIAVRGVGRSGIGSSDSENSIFYSNDGRLHNTLSRRYDGKSNEDQHLVVAELALDIEIVEGTPVDNAQEQRNRFYTRLCIAILLVVTGVMALALGFALPNKKNDEALPPTTISTEPPTTISTEPCWSNGTICGEGTTCKSCCNGSGYWYSLAFTACGQEPCWEGGTRCLAGTQCNRCCNGYEWNINKFGDFCT